MPIPQAVHLLESYIQEENRTRGGVQDDTFNRGQWRMLATNPGIFELDYEAIRNRMTIYKEELIATVFHPKRMQPLFDFLEKNREPISSIEKYI
jgi:hypothetical protein